MRRRAVSSNATFIESVVLLFSLFFLDIQTSDLGEAEEEIDIDNSSSDSMTIGINAQFLLDLLKEIDTFSIRCGISGQMSPVTFFPDDDSSYISVIMPIQIKSGNID